MDTGKPIWEARFDIEGCADALEFFGGLATTLFGQFIMLMLLSFPTSQKKTCFCWKKKQVCP